jgi:uridine kinase
MPALRSQARQTVQVILPDGRVYEAPSGTPLVDFIRQAESDQPPAQPAEWAIAAMIENRLRELSIPIKRDTEVRPITLQELDGTRIYRRSLAFLLVAAAHRLFPGVQVFIDHALPQRAFYCHLGQHPPLSAEQVKQLAATMRQMVAADETIERQQLELEAARAYFADKGDEQKVRLLQFRTRRFLQVYRLGDFSDYFFGYMVPSTGFLQWFDLEPHQQGFFLRYPDEQDPTEIRPITKTSRLDQVFQEAAQWLKLLEVRDIGQLNEAIQKGRLRELILVAEALHERRIAEIGGQIAERRHAGSRVILIAGPSSSGKTTFAKRLAIQLMTHGLKPFTLELDNYFVDRDKTPRDEKGDYDFESLGAIHVERLNEDIRALLQGQQVTLPRFDFPTGRSLPGQQVQLSPEHMILMEGIHALNPALTPSLSPNLAYRVYISALTQINIDHYNRVSTTDVRLLRRIVRDATHRGWTATDTLARWESVGRGERLNIFPYQELADTMFNSALVYELAVMRNVAEPHLLRVSLEHPKWSEANRLLALLSWVMPALAEGIPDNSLLREFIGGSNLATYHPGT